MTLPPERIGDKGLRYEIRYTDAETGEEKVFGWCDTWKGANQMRNGVLQWPRATDAWIEDRSDES